MVTDVGNRFAQARVRAFGAAGLLMLVSVALIAMLRFGLQVPAWSIPLPAILAQLATLAGLATLFSLAPRNQLLFARAGLVATLAAVGVIIAGAAWLIIAGEKGPPPGIVVLAAAFIGCQMVAFIANAFALRDLERIGRSIALCFLVPPLLSGVMIGVALAHGMEAALRLDLYTNAGTGIALLCAAAILRQAPSGEN